eukprot:scaffold9888_cov123-Isochrysis_galbana.AAC.2
MLSAAGSFTVTARLEPRARRVHTGARRSHPADALLPASTARPEMRGCQYCGASSSVLLAPWAESRPPHWTH